MENTCQTPIKKRFFVLDENMFGFVTPRQPNQLSVLSSSVIRGASHMPKDGAYPIMPGMAGMRPATMQDFEAFRVSSKGYDADPTFEMPEN